MTKHIDYVKNNPKSSPSDSDHHYNFLSFLRLLIKYEHSEIPQDDVDSVGTAFLYEVFKELKNDFFNKLYFPRPEYEEIKDWLPLKWASFLSGQLGSGKSTLLLKLNKELETHGNYNPIYLDLSKHYELLDPYDDKIEEGFEDDEHSKEMAKHEIDEELFDAVTIKKNLPRDLVCHIIDYEIRNFFRNIDDSFDSHLELYRIQTLFEYRKFAASIRGTLNPKTRSEWVLALRKKEYESWKIEIDKNLETNFSEDLKTTLKYLKEANPKKINLIILDNVDRYSNYLQRKIFSKALVIAREEIAKIIIAVRSENLTNLRHQGQHQEIFHQANLNLPDDASLIRIKNNTGLVRAFLEKRFFYLKELQTDVVKREKFGEVYGKPLNIDYDEFYNKFWHVFDLSIQKSSKGNVLISFGRWCNCSLRHLAEQTLDYVEHIISNRDYPYTLKKLIKTNDQINHRYLRSLVYKKMVCGQSFTPRDDSFLNFFRDMSTNSVNREFYFLELKILSYLLDNDIVEYGKLLNDFAICGVERKTVFECLCSLRTKRDKNIGRGYIYIDLRENRIEPYMNDRTLVFLLPAGTFLYDKLSTSCEYLFWSALFLETDFIFREFLSGNDIDYINYIDLQDDYHKASIATEYLTAFIIPKIIEEWNDIHRKTDSGLRKEQKRFLLNFTIKACHWSKKAISSLNKYISGIYDTRVSDIQLLRVSLEESEEKINNILGI